MRFLILILMLSIFSVNSQEILSAPEPSDNGVIRLDDNPPQKTLAKTNSTPSSPIVEDVTKNTTNAPVQNATTISSTTSIPSSTEMQSEIEKITVKVDPPKEMNLEAQESERSETVSNMTAPLKEANNITLDEIFGNATDSNMTAPSKETNNITLDEIFGNATGSNESTDRPKIIAERQKDGYIFVNPFVPQRGFSTTVESSIVTIFMLILLRTLF